MIVTDTNGSYECMTVSMANTIATAVANAVAIAIAVAALLPCYTGNPPHCRPSCLTHGHANSLFTVSSTMIDFCMIVWACNRISNSIVLSFR